MGDKVCHIIAFCLLLGTCGVVRAGDALPLVGCETNRHFIVSFPARDVRACDVIVCGGGPAGCAAAIADGAANREVDVSALLSELRARGCIVDKSALPVVRPRMDPK